MTRDSSTLGPLGGTQTAVDRRDLMCVGLALAIAIAVRLVPYRGICSPDEMNYLRHAAEWASGRFEMKDVLYLHGTRPLFFVPVAWAFAGFGVSETAAVAWPFLASLVTVALVYLIARRLFDRETAVYSGACAAFLPLLAAEATRLLPGGVMNLLIGLSGLCFIVSEDAGKNRWMWLALSGALFGAMQMVVELGLVFGWFFVVALLVWRRHPVWSYWPVVAGFGALVAASLAYYWVETGDPLFKTEISKKILVAQPAPFKPFYYLKVMLAPLTANGGVLYFAGLGCVAAIVTKRREALFVVLWSVFTWLFIEYGSSSVFEYRPLFKSTRYLSVVSVPGAVLAGYAIAQVRAGARAVGVDRSQVWWAAVGAVFVVIAVMSSVTLRTGSDQTRVYRRQLDKVGEHVRSYKGETIFVTHWLWNTQVGYYMGFDDDYFPSGYDPYHAVRVESADKRSKNRYVQCLKAGEPMGPALLIHDEALFAVSRGEKDAGSLQPGEIPVELAEIPSEWTLVERIPISESYVAALYNIPEGAAWPDRE